MEYKALLFLCCWVSQCSGMVDEYMSCDRLFAESQASSRVARQIMEDIPCDMAAKAYCEHKGTGYPEAAIWRFKEENRALMRRLYGDMESNSVYREMRSVMSSSMADGTSEEEEARNLHNLPSEEHSIFSSLDGYNIRVGSGLATVQSAREPVMEPRPVEHRLPVKRKLVKKKRKQQKVTTTPAPLAVESRDGPGVELPLEEELRRAELAPELAVLSPELPDQSDSPSGAAAAAAIPDQVESVEQPSTGGLLGGLIDDVERLVGDLLPDTNREDNNSGLSKDGAVMLDDSPFYVDDPTPLADSVAPPAPPLAETVEAPPPLADAATAVEEYDYVYEELPEEEDVSQNYVGPSFNACPVKEEVFAPYWANNTRDQVLALLNLYPFEQYIHMETCKYEEEEMMCRPGCRCEQQYRLHRLLAFDPTNECRGIFSDWFRFPSYCVCKCYHSFPDSFMPEPSRNSRGHERKPRLGEQEATGNPKSRSIPAVLPYEAREALLRDARKEQGAFRVPRREEHVFGGGGKPASEDGISAASEEGVIPRTAIEAGTPVRVASESGGDKVANVDNSAENMVETGRAIESSADRSAEHFLYGNHPVLEYKLTDGTGGVVKKTPRRRRRK